jgi:hypothetical protein
MQDRPTSVELLAAVREFIQELLPDLEGRRQFHARVAANVVGIVERELEMEEGLVREEWERLVTLLAVAGERPETFAATHRAVGNMNRQLAAAIRAGELDERWEEVMLAIEATVAGKLRVANPGWAEES